MESFIASLDGARRARVLGFTDPEVLEELALHPDISVRQAVCENLATPLQVVQDLTLDSDPLVVNAAYKRLGITL